MHQRGLSSCYSVSESVATSSSKSASAIAIAAAINAKTGLTGVTAKAEPNIIVGTTFTNNSLDKTVRVNGVSVAITAAQAATRGGIVTELNKVSGQTGVVASDNGRGLTLVAADGRNISLAVITNTANVDADSANGIDAAELAIGNTARANSIGIDSANTHTIAVATATTFASAFTTYASVTLTSELAFNLEGGSDGNQSFASLGFKTGTVGGANNGIKIANVDVGIKTVWSQRLPT